MTFAHFLLASTGLSTSAYSNISHAALYNLSTSVGGRLFSGAPVAHPCFRSSPGDRAECVTVQNQYLNETYRTDNFGAWINTQWETCQSTGAQCLLDSSDPTGTIPSESCQLGSVPGLFIDVRNSEDVAAAFKFSKETRVPLVVKNTGHDYKGRSSAPNSLALWVRWDYSLVPPKIELRVHFYTNVSVHPDIGLSQAGVQWAEAYEFADAHNITLVGGSDKTVGVVGGWLQGGGHGVLSNTMGLGVDRVVEGGTFGVVLDATLLASPARNFGTSWRTTVSNGGAQGWGGFSMSNLAILVNPVLDAGDAATSMAPLIDFGQKLLDEGVPGAGKLVTTYPSFFAFFNEFTSGHVATVGASLAIASRLVDKASFATPEKRAALVDALQATNDAGPGMIIQLTAPVSYAYEGGTSVTDAWRSSLYHVTAIAPWAWNATVAEKRAAYQSASTAIDNLRKITPDAAYQNEADVYEPNHEVTFWGSHYQQLLRIKRKYDPRQLLDCWQCIGWNAQSPRFSCYL
ncbi:Cytokinin dehydrogenase 11 [Mycena sanguinolenta]|uniref:Cytokinin dehydrogenase 11 n=1 Tax=Mycena sanguinolenta TaxID=230812 RepID=A0A8H7DFX3_9AGAR|nr:Cytokinin dehydrogenase 11 [Mycena sanguinolenta]